MVLFKRLCWIPFLNLEVISRFPSVFVTREDIGTTSATAGDSLKTLRKKKDSILLISVLGILLDTPSSSRDGYAFGFLLSFPVNNTISHNMSGWHYNDKSTRRIQGSHQESISRSRLFSMEYKPLPSHNSPIICSSC